MMAGSRRVSVHTVQGFWVSILPHTRQISIFSSAVCIAAASGAMICSRFLMRNSAARRAERGPSPGRRASSPIRRSISGPAAAVGMRTKAACARLLYGGGRRRRTQRRNQLTQAEQGALVFDAGRHFRHRGLEIGREAIFVDHSLLHQETAREHVTRQKSRDRGRHSLHIDVFFHGRPPSDAVPPDLPAVRPIQNNFIPGGSGRPPATLCIFSCSSVSALRRASVWAATMRSSRISFSDGCMSVSSILTPFTSPLPESLTVTRPPPDVPSTSIWSSSACIASILDLSSAACFISPRKSAIAHLSCAARVKLLLKDRRPLRPAARHGEVARRRQSRRHRAQAPAPHPRGPPAAVPVASPPCPCARPRSRHPESARAQPAPAGPRARQS